MASEAVYYALITGLHWLSTTGIKLKAQMWAALSSNEYSGTSRVPASFLAHLIIT